MESSARIEPTAQRVRFGADIRGEIGAEMETLGASRALILSTPNQAAMAMEIAEQLGSRAAGVYTKARVHTPAEITEEAVAHARGVTADSVVAVGGGSTIGLGKAIALRTDLPQIVVPTTYAGSEATPILGETKDGLKTTISDPKVLPEVILYDPRLVVSLPTDLTVTSALNAMAHAAEGLYARNRDDETTELACLGLQAFADGLAAVVEDPRDLTAREATLRGAWACGTVLGKVGMALHHKLCHALGGSFDLPHAETHAVILPHAIRYNEVEVPKLLAPVSRILDGPAPGLSIWRFAQRNGAPMSLGTLGLTEDDIDRAVSIVMQKPYWNPRPITEEGIRALLRSALEGRAPDA